MLNKQIDKYVSFKPDPAAFEVDAFFMSWTNLKFYAFPPFSCISPCFQKINLEKANRYYSGTKVDNPTILHCACERFYCNQKEQAQLGNASTTQHESKNSKEIRSADLLGVRENFITAGLP